MWRRTPLKATIDQGNVRFYKVFRGGHPEFVRRPGATSLTATRCAEVPENSKKQQVYKVSLPVVRGERVPASAASCTAAWCTEFAGPRKRQETTGFTRFSGWSPGRGVRRAQVPPIPRWGGARDEQKC